MQIKNQYMGKITDFGRRLGDPRFAGQVVFVIIVLMISWSGIKAIQTNYGLQKQIASLQQQNQLQELQNNNLKLQNEYYDSNQYLELSARQNFGLAAPGEKLVIVPKEVALAHTVDLKEDASPAAKAEPPAWRGHFESWVDFFLHRQTD